MVLGGAAAVGSADPSSTSSALHQAAETSANKACLRQQKPVTAPAHLLPISKPLMVGDKHN